MKADVNGPFSQEGGNPKPMVLTNLLPVRRMGPLPWISVLT